MEIVIRATVIYWFLWLVVRGTGKRSLAQITPLDLLVIVVFGDFVQQSVTGEDMSIFGGIIAISTFAVWMLLGDLFSRRSRRVDHVLNGRPMVVVEHGTIHMRRLERERLTVDDLRRSARQEGIASLDDVAFAVVETDGSFSFIQES